MYLVLALLATIFLVKLVMSLAWRLSFDVSLMHYVAYLINEHVFAPYRDIFDINMPVSYLVHMAVGKMFGYSDLALRMADITWLAATLTVTWFIIKPTGRIAALASCLLFGLIYLGAGSYMSFERDFLAILPMAIALLIATQHRSRYSVKLVHLLIGILFAFVALIKPHMVIGLPVLIVYNCTQGGYYGWDSGGKLIKACIIGGFFSTLGFLLGLAIPLLWLWKIGAIEAFWDILSLHVPLYSQMDLHHNFTDDPLSRFKQSLLWYFTFGGFDVLLMSSAIGLYCIWTEPLFVETRKLALLLLSLTITYSIYVAIGGRFLSYHWMPYIYFSCLCTGLVLASPPPMGRPNRFRSLLPLFVFILIVMVTVKPIGSVLQVPRSVVQILHGHLPSPPPPKDGRVDEIAAYLNKHLSPTDRVQPLDWDGGALQAMLLSKAVTATPYISDWQFYHHVSTPYIQGLRNDFVVELEQAMPTFIIDVHAKTRVTGIDTTYDFPELEAFIKKHYIKDYTGNGFNILKRSVLE